MHGVINQKRNLVAAHIGGWRTLRRSWISVFVFVGICFLAPDMFAGPKRVLVLHSYGRDFAPFSIIAATFRTEVAQTYPGPLEFHEPSLEEQHEAASADRPLLSYLREVFADRPPDLIVTIAEPASLFVGRNRGELFPNVPLLAIVNQRLIPVMSKTPNTTIVPIEVQIPPLLQNIRELLPNTTNVLWVLGSSPFEQYWREQCKMELAPFTNAVTITYANEMSLEQIQARAKSLRAGSAILYATMMVDGAGVPHQEERALKRIREVASVPMFGVLEHQLGNGIVGGRLISMDALGRQLAQAGAKLLQGEKVAAVEPTAPGHPAYDWRELRKWEIDQARLPVGSEIRYRTPTFWEQYKWAIIGVNAVCLVEAVLIIGLVRSRQHLKRAQAELTQSDERMEMASKAARLGMWVWDMPADRAWMSENCKLIFGFAPAREVTFEEIRQRVHPEDRQTRDDALQRALDEGGRYELQYRLQLADGSVRWVASSGRAERDANGKPARMLGVIMDITERRRAEEAAREVSGRLITAQEDERRRIARDLHDDLNQRLAMLSVDLELYGQESVGPERGPSGRVLEMAQQVKDLSSEVHRLAYQLHPAKLDQLGFVAAARSFCREISEQSQIPIVFNHENVPDTFDPEVSLCLYRVIQESLRNVVRHSAATQATVEIAVENENVRLRVSDDGRGFIVADPARNSGLGLVSMEERIRLLHGTISIQSQNGQGTVIELKVPQRAHVKQSAQP